MKKVLVILMLLLLMHCDENVQAQKSQQEAITALRTLGAAIDKDRNGNVVALGLRGKQGTDAALVHLKSLPRLNTFLLFRTQVSDVGLQHLKGRTNLEILWLDSPQISDAGLVHLKGMANLEKLRIRSIKITEAKFGVGR